MNEHDRNSRPPVPPVPPAPPRLSLAKRWLSLIRPVLIAIGGAMVVFGLYEVVERLWLKQVDSDTIAMLHVVRGMLASLVAAVVVGGLIVRASPSLLVPMPSGEQWAQGAQGREADRLTHFARWFIVMRWIAIVIAGVAVFVTVKVTHLLPDAVWWPLIVLIGILAGLNIFYAVCLRRELLRSWLIPIQLYADLTILTLLLHFSGGIENPLSLVMLFHVIIGGIVLRRTQSFTVAGVAIALLGVLAALEWAGTVEHYTLLIFPHGHNAQGLQHASHQLLYVTSQVALQAVLLLLTAYFVTTLAQRLRDDERQIEHLANRTLAKHKQLQQSQAQMLRAGQLAAVGELAGKIAHEVNNPIAIISAKARLLLSDHRDAMSEKVRQELEKVVGQSDRVAKIAQGLLSYCRPSATQRTPLDICVPIRKAIGVIEQPARSRGIEICNRLPATIPQVKANADEMEQVFLNLFLNALDAMPKGGKLTVTAQVKPDSYADTLSWLAIDVQDTGTGMDPAVLEHAFEPFFTSKPQGKGTGLGLSICQGLIHSHGGQITIQSQPGQGTHITLTLPIGAGENVMETDDA